MAKMNNIYMPDGFPNLPDFKAMQSATSSAATAAAAAQATANAAAPQATIAPVEAGTKSAHAYDQGDLLYHDGKLYKAKTSIAIDDTFTVNTNIEEVNLVDQIPAGYTPTDLSFITTGLSYDSSKVSIFEGGYCVDRGICYVNMILVTTASLSSGVIVTGFPDIANVFNFPCVMASSTDFSDPTACYLALMHTGANKAQLANWATITSHKAVCIDLFYRIKEV